MNYRTRLKSLLNSNIYNFDYFQCENVCRFCWTKNAHRELAAIKIKDIQTEIKILLIEQVQECLNIDLICAKGPDKICDVCYDVVENFFNFKIFCTKTNEKLNEILNENSNKPLKQINLSSCSVKVENKDIDCEQSELSNDDLFDECQKSDDDEPIMNLIKTKKNTAKKPKLYKTKRCSTYCNICHKDYLSDENFLTHNSQWHGIEENGLYKCYGCERRFQTRRSRLVHETSFCKELQDGYKCPLCEGFIPRRRTLETHMKAHRNNLLIEQPENLFSCRKCEKNFNTKGMLKNHEVSAHKTDRKNYVCETCGRIFTRQDYLRKHNLAHTGVKLHICPHCNFRTVQRSSLIVHIRKHTGERPFACDLCPQRCISSSNLKAHTRRHLGLKTYQCSICPKKFGYKTSLEEHIAASHERSQTHSCHYCGANYSRKRGLRRHIQAKHACEKDGQTSHNSDNTRNIEKDDAQKNFLKDDDFVQNEESVFT